MHYKFDSLSIADCWDEVFDGLFNHRLRRSHIPNYNLSVACACGLDTYEQYARLNKGRNTPAVIQKDATQRFERRMYSLPTYPPSWYPPCQLP